MRIVSLLCKIDDFFLEYAAYISSHCLPSEGGSETRGRRRCLPPSEVMTIVITFQQSNYRTFGHFYLKHVCVYWHSEFPNLVSYSRFVQLKQEVLGLLKLYLATPLGDSAGVSFVDSTRLRVCDNRRISSHKGFAGHAERSKTSMGWFYGFKLHLVINHTGDLLDVALTPGNVDDRKPLRKFAERLHGSLYGDRGYISKNLREALSEQGVNLVYKVRKNMEPLDLSVSDEVLLKKRMLVETVIRELKTQMQVEHSRHRSVENFQVNVFSAFIAYQLLENKPTLNLAELHEVRDLPGIF